MHCHPCIICSHHQGSHPISIFVVSFQMERAKLQRDNEERLDQQAVRYEERITELHSVIAELNKKIDRTQPSDVIR